LDEGFEVADLTIPVRHVVGSRGSATVHVRDKADPRPPQVGKSQEGALISPLELAALRVESIAESVRQRKRLFPRWTEEEWEIRTQLAAAYRLFSVYGWTDLIYNHLTVRLPHKYVRKIGDETIEEECFLINPFGLSFHEITASSLVTVNMHGDILDGGCYPDRRINKAG